MHRHFPASRPMVEHALFIGAVLLVAAHVGLAWAETKDATLFTEWPEHIELPPPGQAVLRISGQDLMFDDMTTCGVVDGGLGFMMRAGRKDEEGRYQSFRMYRRLAGDRSTLASEEDLVQLSVRDHDHTWAHALMRLQRRQSGESVTRIHGNADGWPAVNVRYRGTAVWASGEMTRRFDSSDNIPAGMFIAVAHCP